MNSNRITKSKVPITKKLKNNVATQSLWQKRVNWFSTQAKRGEVRATFKEHIYLCSECAASAREVFGELSS